MKPPRRAIQWTACRRGGGVAGGVEVTEMAPYSACHSLGSNRAVHGVSGIAQLGVGKFGHTAHESSSDLLVMAAPLVAIQVLEMVGALFSVFSIPAEPPMQKMWV